MIFMGWILFWQIVILAMWFYILGYALIEGYLRKKFDKDLALHDVKSGSKSYNDYRSDKLGE